ncbi:lactate/malate family dehydrogenase, partial [Staphylococcus epidermidis]|uniref:lactate/malate family dehydrogenase n=1 Tax=Staphylococcus epidermidis TaxID=1282 RepID=UPI003F68B36C
HSHILLMTAAIPSKSRMTRQELLQTNQQILPQTPLQIPTYPPHSIIILFTNPLHLITYTPFKPSPFPKEPIIPQSPILHPATYPTFIPQQLNLSLKHLNPFVLPPHAHTILPFI